MVDVLDLTLLAAPRRRELAGVWSTSLSTRTWTSFVYPWSILLLYIRPSQFSAVVAGHARAGSNLLSAFSSSCGWVVGIFRKCVSHRYQCRPQGCECVPVPSSQHTGHLACSTGFRYRWCHSSSYPSLRDRDFVCGERDHLHRLH